jgi:hypothetical protein
MSSKTTIARRRRGSAARSAGRPAAAMTQYSRAHYLLIGLALGGLWLLSGGRSLLFHAVQMLAVMSAITGVQIVLRRRAGQVVPYVRLAVPKLALVGLAVGGEWLFAQLTGRSNAIVAGSLVVLVAAVGPKLDHVAAKRAAYRARSARGPEALGSPGIEPGTRATFGITGTKED